MEIQATANEVQWDTNVSVELIFFRDVVLGFLVRLLALDNVEKSSLQREAAERTLVQRAVEGDNTAFVALYDQYVTQVYKHVYYRVSSEAEAEDITQETFIKAWKAIKRFRITGAPFVSWLYTISRNLMMDHYKSKKRDSMVHEAMKEECPISDERSPEKLMTEQFDKSRILQAVQTLRGDKQEVILMRFIDGLSYKEIAERLHKTEGAIRVIQFRALDDLKRIVTSPRVGDYE